ncbi:hypothetical protein GTH32_05800 [Alteromonas sp. 345S023]|uniref:Uncharacterized protein n=1 Tax=Alteromonas profundi TaxID=2696062 RepID=A0A7X5LJV9_9ALTE|nr:hypothetical protein [Alteromonas profundi]NDV90710.1 hypothetical protein [Alteromonas profundi]
MPRFCLSALGRLRYIGKGFNAKPGDIVHSRQIAAYADIENSVKLAPAIIQQ